MAQSEYSVSRSSRIKLWITTSAIFFDFPFLYEHKSAFIRLTLTYAFQTLYGSLMGAEMFYEKFGFNDFQFIYTLFYTSQSLINPETEGGNRTPSFITDNSLTLSGCELICMHRAPRLLVRFSHLDSPGCCAPQFRFRVGAVYSRYSLAARL